MCVRIMRYAISEASTVKPLPQVWRMVIAFLISIALNGVLLAIASSIDPRQADLSRIASVANVLLGPANALTEWLAPGHGGAQIAALFISSIVLYTGVAWVALSLPVWWQHRE